MPCPLGRAPLSAVEKGSWIIRDCLPHRQDHRVPLAFGVWEGHVPVPPRLASFGVDPFPAESPRALSSDPAHPGMEMWSVFEPRPLGREGPQRFWRRGQGHLPWPLQWLSPAAFSLHAETFRGLAQAPDYGLPCSFSPPSPLIKIIFIFITIITLYTWIAWIRYCWVKGT